MNIKLNDKQLNKIKNIYNINERVTIQVTTKQIAK